MFALWHACADRAIIGVSFLKTIIALSEAIIFPVIIHMPILLLIGLFIPRVIIAVLWLFSSWFSVVESMILGILGFLFMPYTLLWYSVVMHWNGGEWGGLQIIVLIFAILADLGIPGKGYNDRH